VLRDGEITCDIHAQHLQTATARDFWYLRGLCSMPSPAPTIREDHLARLFAIQPEVVPVRPRLNVDQFGMTRGFVTGSIHMNRILPETIRVTRMCIFIQIFGVGFERGICFETVHNGLSRSSKVVDFGTNRKRVCDFLLVINKFNSNLGLILPRFRDIAGFLPIRATPPYFTQILGCSLWMLDCPRYINVTDRRPDRRMTYDSNTAPALRASRGNN